MRCFMNWETNRSFKDAKSDFVLEGEIEAVYIFPKPRRGNELFPKITAKKVLVEGLRQAEQTENKTAEAERHDDPF